MRRRLRAQCCFPFWQFLARAFRTAQCQCRHRGAVARARCVSLCPGRVPSMVAFERSDVLARRAVHVSSTTPCSLALSRAMHSESRTVHVVARAPRLSRVGCVGAKLALRPLRCDVCPIIVGHSPLVWHASGDMALAPHLRSVENVRRLMRLNMQAFCHCNVRNQDTPCVRACFHDEIFFRHRRCTECNLCRERRVWSRKRRETGLERC